MAENSEHAIALAKTPLFQGLGPTRVQMLLAYAETREVAAGEMIIEEGALLRGLHVVLKGWVRVSKKGHTEVARLETGSFIGEISIFGRNLCATATVESPDASTQLIIQRSALDLWFKEDPEIPGIFFRNLASELCDRLAATTELLAVGQAVRSGSTA
jgi:CRP/FNR family transcriptional regulator, cyclic AMP receptor protein